MEDKIEDIFVAENIKTKEYVYIVKKTKIVYSDDDCEYESSISTFYVFNIQTLTICDIVDYDAILFTIGCKNNKQKYIQCSLTRSVGQNIANYLRSYCHKPNEELVIDSAFSQTVDEEYSTDNNIALIKRYESFCKKLTNEYKGKWIRISASSKYSSTYICINEFTFTNDSSYPTLCAVGKSISFVDSHFNNNHKARMFQYIISESDETTMDIEPLLETIFNKQHKLQSEVFKLTDINEMNSEFLEMNTDLSECFNNFKK